jgi:hypothetical protein
MAEQRGGAARPDEDPAWAEVREAYRDRNLGLFVGAGVSAAVGLPSWGSLVERLLERARARRADDETLKEIEELARRQRYIDALSAAKQVVGGPDFGAVVEHSLDDRRLRAPVPAVAAAIAALAPNLCALITTNLDGVLERALAGQWPVIARATPDIGQRPRTIFKIHGTLAERSTWVLTREDYDRAMHADPLLKDAFAALFRVRKLLFVGYGLADDDFDEVLARMRAFAGDAPPRHHALVAAAEVKPHRRRELEKAGVRLIPYDNADGTHAKVVQLERGDSEGQLGHVAVAIVERPLDELAELGGARANLAADSAPTS